MGVTKSILMEAWIRMAGGVECEWLYVIGMGDLLRKSNWQTVLDRSVGGGGDGSKG